ncbi:MAG: ester cyclase [candidate division Zixibacteria bacterium]|nr:ester cyclase [candidate division Zixibacteria bacterium]
MTKTSAKELRQIARRWIEEGWSKGNVRIVDELHAPDFVDRDPSGREPTNEGFRKGIKELYAAFPDFNAKVEELVVEIETGKVAILWSATGTHKGGFMNIPPTNKKIHFKGIEIITIKNGKITERWGEWDGIDILQQLGVI